MNLEKLQNTKSIHRYHVNPWLIHVNVWQKPLQYCKVISLQLIKINGKKNTQKSFAFLYTNNEKSERAIKESTRFTIATKRIKYLGINLAKETKELYIENYKTLKKQIKDDINR